MKKRNSRGFTLVELLAVVLILAAIALVTSPFVLQALSNAQKSSFKSSVDGIIRSVKSDQNANNYEADSYTIKDGVITRLDGSFLSVKGGSKENGTVVIDADGIIKASIQNGTWCAIKKATEEKVSIIKYDKNTCIIQ